MQIFLRFGEKLIYLSQSAAMLLAIVAFATQSQPLLAAGTVLAPGDIALTGYITNGTPDSFSFMPLVPLSAGTEIYFTDDGWTGTNFFAVTDINADGERLTRLTINNPITPGTIIRSNDVSLNFTWAITGAIGAGGIYQELGLAVNGDQITAVQSTNNTNPLFSGFTGLAQIDYTGAFEPAINNNTGDILPGLSQGAGTAVLFNNQSSYAAFNLNTLASGTAAEWRTAIANPANWTFNTTGTSLPTGAAPVLTPHTSLELPAVADSYVASNRPNQSFGADSLYLGYNQTGDAFGVQRIFMRFDIAGNLPTNATIQSARLRLHLSFASPISDTAMTTGLRPLNGVWNESVTWNTQPALAAERPGIGVGSALDWYEWDVTTLVREWTTGATVNNGVALIGDESVQQRERAFYARETATDFFPRLVVDYTVPVDIEAPIVTVDPLPALVANNFTVVWQGSDRGGSGINYYDVQYRVDGDEWVNWQSQVTFTSAEFTAGLNGHRYEFRARGVDKAGNVEAFGNPEAATTVDTPTPTPTVTPTPTSTATPPVGDNADEPNDTCTQARPIPSDGRLQEHTFYQAADVDWVRFDAVAGMMYAITIDVPPTSPADVALELYTDCAALPTEGQDYSFSPGIRLEFTAPATGPIWLKSTNYTSAVAGAHVRYELAVRARNTTASPGALILVAGAIKDNDPVQPNIYQVTNAVYQLFIDHGYTDDRIYYLAPDLQQAHADARSTVSNLEAAITTWATDKVGPDRALTLYLMDHGAKELFYLDKRYQQWVTPGQLDAWLTTLEAAHPGLKVNVIIEACYAGAFLSPPQSISKAGRVVITSSDDNNLAWASSKGAHFSGHFLEGLRRGESLFSSFREAQIAASIAHPNQRPWLDSDGNGHPQEATDQVEAAQRGFTFAGTLPDETWPPYIASVEPPLKIDNDRGQIRADVRDDVAIDDVWAVIYPPSYVAPTESEALVQEASLETLKLLDQGNGWYGVTYTNFSERGRYRIVLYAQDNQGIDARPVVIEVSTGSRLFLPLIKR